MKKSPLVLFLLLLATNSFCQRYLRVYDLQEKRIATGRFRGTTDSGLVLHNGRVEIEISYREIGTIRAYRTIFHDILLTSLVTVSTGLIMGSIQDGQTRQVSSSTSGYNMFSNFQLNLPTNTEFNVAAGFWGGQLIGSGIFLVKKKRKYFLNGSYTSWLVVRSLLDKDLKK